MSSYKDYTGIFSTLVTPGFETQTLLQSIVPFPISQIGSDAFLEAYCIHMERLSIQACLTAGLVSERDSVEISLNGIDPTVFGSEGEYIVDAFWEDSDRIEGMIQTLLAIEFWRENVLFCRKNSDEKDDYEELNEVDGGQDEKRTVLADRLADNGNGLRAAFILHAETTIVSLLSLIFYKGIPPALLEGKNGDETLLALVDYCARQLIFLGTPEQSNEALSKQKNPRPTSDLANYLANRSRLDEIQDSVYDTTYQTAITSVALSRYLCENLSEFGPSLVSRICEVHDFPLLMIPLIEEPPWTRRRRVAKGGGQSTMVWEKLNDQNEWSIVSNADLLRLTKLEGQPWLALYHLTASKVGREAYGLDEFRKTNLMRLRRYLHKTLLDQIPVLEDVARYLDELSIMGVPPSGEGARRASSNAPSSGLLMQRVDSLRESIVSKKQANDLSFWDEIVDNQWNGIFSKVTDSQDHLLRRIGDEVYTGLEEEIGTSQGCELPQDNHDAKAAPARRLEKVTLTIAGINDDTAEFELTIVSGDNGTVTDTPLGQFRRSKLNPKLVSDDNSEAIFPLGQVTAKVQFDAAASNSSDVLLSLDSLDLPTSQPNSTPNSYEELGLELPSDFAAKEWRQLGDLHEKRVVLQLGFKRLDCGVLPAGCTYLRGYALSFAFISQPVVS